MKWNRGLSVAADRAERIAKAAMAAADKLDSVGLHGPANDVRRVCRSNSSYRETCRRLYLDNVELRERLNNPAKEA